MQLEVAFGVTSSVGLLVELDKKPQIPSAFDDNFLGLVDIKIGVFQAHGVGARLHRNFKKGCHAQSLSIDPNLRPGFGIDG